MEKYSPNPQRAKELLNEVKNKGGIDLSPLIFLLTEIKEELKKDKQNIVLEPNIEVNTKDLLVPLEEIKKSILNLKLNDKNSEILLSLIAEIKNEIKNLKIFSEKYDDYFERLI